MSTYSLEEWENYRLISADDREVLTKRVESAMKLGLFPTGSPTLEYRGDKTTYYQAVSRRRKREQKRIYHGGPGGGWSQPAFDKLGHPIYEEYE